METLLHREQRKAEVKHCLLQARHHVKNGDANAAMQFAMRAIRQSGEQPLLAQAQAASMEGQGDPIDQISALLDNLDMQGLTSSNPKAMGGGVGATVVEASAIVSHTTVDSALSDGSSYICAGCRGVVSIHRRQAHDEAWCPTLP